MRRAAAPRTSSPDGCTSCCNGRRIDASAEEAGLTPIVGREVELDVVERFLDRVPVGPVGLVVEGPPGIGKTTLWLEVVRSAEARSFRVLVARPAESEVTLSYAVLADLVGEVFGEVRAVLPVPQERALEVALLRADADEPAEPQVIATALV